MSFSETAKSRAKHSRQIILSKRHAHSGQREYRWTA